jgi:hypothetical protein
MLLDGIPTIEITIGRQKKNPKSSPGRPFFSSPFSLSHQNKKLGNYFQRKNQMGCPEGVAGIICKAAEEDICCC